ncbi:MAG: Uma2 family endonuclease, partial [Microcoleus sp.]
RIPYYGIYEIKTGRLEVYHLIDFAYRRIEPNERGHYPIPLLDVELGLWQGSYQNQEMLWLRWWDSQGNLLLIGSEQVEIERARVEQELQRAEQAERKAEQAERKAEQAERKAAQLADRLRAMGIDPDTED